MDIGGVMPLLATGAACVSVLLLWGSTKANNERRKKEVTIQFTDSHELHTEELKHHISSMYQNGRVVTALVEADETFKWQIEKYLFSMERLAVGVNTKVFDLLVFDRIMGFKTIEHFDALCEYIREVRIKESYPRKYCEFEQLVRQLRNLHSAATIKQGNLSRTFDG